MKKFKVLLLTILGLAVFLRLYGILDNYYFSGELGKELLYMRHFSLTKTLPLTGMTTSHEWLSYGPIYYWIMIPVFNLLNGNPLILFYSALTVSILGLILNFVIVKKISTEKVAIISTALQAISPLLIWQTQSSKLHTFFFILSPILMYLLYLLWNGKKKWLIYTGIVFGLMFSFHFSQIPLLGVLVLLFMIKKYKFTDYLKFGAGVLIPNLTLLWQDKNLLIWIPYRIITSGGRDLVGTLNSFNEFMGRNIFWDHKLWVLASIIFLTVLIHFIWSNHKKIKKDFLIFYLTSSISFIFLANFLHSSPPVHYFLPVFTTVPILFALYLDKQKYWWVALVLIFLINFKGYFNFQKPNDFVPLATQVRIADSIVKDANGSEFSIKRIGLYDYFPETYSQNYKYLILSRGGKLTDKSKNIYTINDFTNSYSKEK